MQYILPFGKSERELIEIDAQIENAHSQLEAAKARSFLHKTKL